MNKNKIENTFLLFNLLFPGTYLYETGEHYETSFEYYDDTYDGEEEFAPRLIEGEFDLDVYDPERMEKEAFVVETSEATDVDGGSNGCDTYVRKSPVVSPLTHSNPDKEFLSRVIEQSTAKGYTELTALLLEKCKDYYTVSSELDYIGSLEDDDENDDDFGELQVTCDVSLR